MFSEIKEVLCVAVKIKSLSAQNSVDGYPAILSQVSRRQRESGGFLCHNVPSLIDIQV